MAKYATIDTKGLLQMIDTQISWMEFIINFDEIGWKNKIAAENNLKKLTELRQQLWESL